MADKRPQALSKADRAEMYRAFLEADEDALRIILRHRGHTIFLSAKPEDAAKGQVVQLLGALAETQQRIEGVRLPESSHDVV